MGACLWIGAQLSPHQARLQALEEATFPSQSRGPDRRRSGPRRAATFRITFRGLGRERPGSEFKAGPQSWRHRVRADGDVRLDGGQDCGGLHPQIQPQEDCRSSRSKARRGRGWTTGREAWSTIWAKRLKNKEKLGALAARRAAMACSGSILRLPKNPMHERHLRLALSGGVHHIPAQSPLFWGTEWGTR